MNPVKSRRSGKVSSSNFQRKGVAMMKITRLKAAAAILTVDREAGAKEQTADNRESVGTRGRAGMFPPFFAQVEDFC